MQELKNKDAAVVVFSGGQDSTTCLFWALKRYKKVIALSFDYHQKHVKELECAKKICRDHEQKTNNKNKWGIWGGRGKSAVIMK